MKKFNYNFIKILLFSILIITGCEMQLNNESKIEPNFSDQIYDVADVFDKAYYLGDWNLKSVKINGIEIHKSDYIVFGNYMQFTKSNICDFTNKIQNVNVVFLFAEGNKEFNIIVKDEKVPNFNFENDKTIFYLGDNAIFQKAKKNFLYQTYEFEYSVTKGIQTYNLIENEENLEFTPDGEGSYIIKADAKKDGISLTYKTINFVIIDISKTNFASQKSIDMECVTTIGSGNSISYDNEIDRMKFEIADENEPRALYIDKNLVSTAIRLGFTKVKMIISHNLKDTEWARIYKLDNKLLEIKNVAPYEDFANGYWQSAFTPKDSEVTYFINLTNKPNELIDFYVAYWACSAKDTFFKEIKFINENAIYEDILEKNNISDIQSNNIANTEALAMGMFICNSGNGNNVIYDNVNNRLQFNITADNDPRAMFIEKNLINHAKNQGYISLKITVSHNLNDYDWARIYKLDNVISSIKDVAPYEDSANGYWQSAYTNKEISNTYIIDLTIMPEALTDFYVAYWACSATQTYFTDIHFEK